MWPLSSTPPKDPKDDLQDKIQPHDESYPDLRYAAYATRIRTLLLSAHRFVAYTSEVGESLRPVAHPILVRGAYAVSWTYLIGDVGFEGYKAFLHQHVPSSAAKAAKTGNGNGDGDDGATGAAEVVKKMAAGFNGTMPRTYSSAVEDYRTIMAERAVFQSLASMALPAFTIHSVVKFSGRAMKGLQSVFLRTWGPVGLGLSVVPLLPTLFDEPVEHAVSWSFKTALRGYFGEDLEEKRPKSLWEKVKGKKD